MTSSSRSQTVTRIAFGVIITFVLAQVLWWTIFQYRYIEQVTGRTLDNWQRDAQVANAVLTQLPDEDAFVVRLRELYPHLRYADELFVVDSAALQAFRREQHGHVRMVTFEAPFFVLVVLSGLWVIAGSLRTERELKKRQQNFLNAVSHEFKTPLSTLRLLIETALYRSLPPEKQRNYLERMERELTRLEATSEQVLASARLEAGSTAPQLQVLDLNGVVREIVERARPGLEARGAFVLLNCHPQPLPVSLDPSAFSIVINNLLDNAVKYTPDSQKPVRVWLEEQGHLALIHVEDKGVGVKAGESGRIFEKFYRTGDELTRESRGVGLGLYLVKSITEAMNGWVRCEAPLEPEHGRGSRFTVVLPRRVELRAELKEQVS